MVPENIRIGTKVYQYEKYGRHEHTFDDCVRRWREYLIIGETRVSWIVGWRESGSEAFKINKKTGEANTGDRIRWSLDGLREEWEEAQWVSKNAYRIAEKVQRCDVATLRQIAALIGYKEAP